MRPSQDGHALSRQGHKGGPVNGVPGVVNVHQGITPGGSPQVLSVKVLRNTEKKDNKVVPGKFKLPALAHGVTQSLLVTPVP